MIAGTSVGGLIAIGLASGRSAAEIADLFEAEGPTIFRARHGGMLWRTATSLFRPKYDGVALRAAVTSIVGARTLQSCRPAVLVPAVSLTTGSLVLFSSEAPSMAGLPASDIAMATAVAPLYFPAATVDNGLYADGGLAANAPDLFALHHAENELRLPRDNIRMLSVGTTTRAIGRPAGVDPRSGLLAWLSELYLVNLAMSCQQGLVRDVTAFALGPSRYVVIDSELGKAQAALLRLDNASRAATLTLNDLAARAAARAMGRRELTVMLGHIAVTPPAARNP